MILRKCWSLHFIFHISHSFTFPEKKTRVFWGKFKHHKCCEIQLPLVDQLTSHFARHCSRFSTDSSCSAVGCWQPWVIINELSTLNWKSWILVNFWLGCGCCESLPWKTCRCRSSRCGLAGTWGGAVPVPHTHLQEPRTQAMMWPQEPKDVALLAILLNCFVLQCEPYS